MGGIAGGPAGTAPAGAGVLTAPAGAGWDRAARSTGTHLPRWRGPIEPRHKRPPPRLPGCLPGPARPPTVSCSA
eukprot:scaffold5213_cov37-Prasinocladus_malaysianus.AAC.1